MTPSPQLAPQDLGQALAVVMTAWEQTSFLSRLSLTLADLPTGKPAIERACNLAVPYLGDACILFVRPWLPAGDRSIQRECAAFSSAIPRALAQRVLADPEFGEFASKLAAQEALGSRAPRELGYLEIPVFLREAWSLRTAQVVSLRLGSGESNGILLLMRTADSPDVVAPDPQVISDFAQQLAASVEHALLQRRYQTSMSDREEVLSIALHELKNPLTALKLNLQMLKLSPREDLDSRIMNLLELQSDRLDQTVDTLLALPRSGTGKVVLSIEMVDLPELVQEALERLGALLTSVGCHAVLTVDEQGLRGKWDRVRVDQILGNLLSNAMKYAPGAPIQVTLTREGRYARMAVRDSGPGVPPDMLEKIFDRYERLDHGRTVSGKGLGLYIVRQIAEALQGRVWAENLPDGGAAFYVELPL